MPLPSGTVYQPSGCGGGEPPPLRWLGHSAIWIPGPSPVAVDPWKWRPKNLRADLALVTAPASDHCSEDDLLRASHDDTIFAGPRCVAERLEPTFPGRVRLLREGDVLELPGVRVTAFPAAGPVRDGRKCGFVLRGECLSYLIETGDGRYLAMGDSAALDEHAGLRPDVAFLAVSGLFVTDPAEAAAAAAAIRPRLAVPVGWGDLHGRLRVAEEFVARCREIGVHARPIRHRPV